MNLNGKVLTAIAKHKFRFIYSKWEQIASIISLLRFMLFRMKTICYIPANHGANLNIELFVSIFKEEKFLEQKFGAKYREYRNQVRRYL